MNQIAELINAEEAEKRAASMRLELWGLQRDLASRREQMETMIRQLIDLGDRAEELGALIRDGEKKERHIKKLIEGA